MQLASETDRRTLSKIVEKFDEFTIGEVNETYERYILNGRNQGQDESIDAYITALRTLAKTFKGSHFLGINNHTLRKRLLQERNLDLKLPLPKLKIFQEHLTQQMMCIG